MELLIGFFIAAVIAMTGVGAGTITAPMLILFLHVPVPQAVGTALVYSAAVKLVVVPIQIWRRQVAWRTLGYMLLAGVPGVILGALFFQHVVRVKGHTLWLYFALGSIIVLSSSWHIYRYFRPVDAIRKRASRPFWLALTMFPIGAEVGFSSSGAGALGTVALLGLTTLDVPRIVGTDLSFGLGLSLIGGGMHLSQGGVNSALLTNLIVGGIAGALVGSGLATRIPSRPMRLALSLWLFAIGVQLCWQAFAKPGS
jgi:uncharacterized membrane protein YfcA